jgi:hypothetical protein
MDAKDILTRYQKGRITLQEFVVDMVGIVDSSNVNEVMTMVPREVLPDMLRFISSYETGRMISINLNGMLASLPSKEQVKVVAEWLKEKQLRGAERGVLVQRALYARPYTKLDDG